MDGDDTGPQLYFSGTPVFTTAVRASSLGSFGARVAVKHAAMVATMLQATQPGPNMYLGQSKEQNRQHQQRAHGFMSDPASRDWFAMSGREQSATSATNITRPARWKPTWPSCHVLRCRVPSGRGLRHMPQDGEAHPVMGMPRGRRSACEVPITRWCP